MSFMSLAGPCRSVRTRSYGWKRGLIRIARAAASAAVCGLAFLRAVPAPPAIAETPVKIVALGDSLTAGLGLPDKDGFVSRLQAAIAAKAIAATVINAGVSGDTSAGGLSRLDWSVPEGTDAVILELGANDMLRGYKPQITHAALDMIMQRLAERHIAVLICGMRAAPNLGADYGRAFETIYPELAATHGALLYAFFLDGVAADRALIQSDGLHPNAAGVGVIVERIMPKVEELIAQVRARRRS